MPRRLRLRGGQVAGGLALASIAILGASGVFESEGSARAAEPGVELVMQLPRRTRFEERARFVADVRFTAPCASASFELDEVYFAAFEAPSSVPAFDEPWSIPLGSIDAADGRPTRREIVVEAHAAREGLTRGVARVRCGGTVKVTVPLSTFVFP